MTSGLDQSAQGGDIDEALLEELLALTPAQRMQRHEGALELVRALRNAAVEHYGFDPLAVATSDSGER